MTEATMDPMERERHARQFGTVPAQVKAFGELTERQQEQVQFMFANWVPYGFYVYLVSQSGNVVGRHNKNVG